MLCHGHQLLAGEVANFVPGVHKNVKNLVDGEQFLYWCPKHATTRAKRNPGDVGRFRWECIEENCSASAFTDLRAGEGEVERLVDGGYGIKHSHPADPDKVGSEHT